MKPWRTLDVYPCDERIAILLLPAPCQLRVYPSPLPPPLPPHTNACTPHPIPSHLSPGGPTRVLAHCAYASGTLSQCQPTPEPAQPLRVTLIQPIPPHLTPVHPVHPVHPTPPPSIPQVGPQGAGRLLRRGALPGHRGGPARVWRVPRLAGRGDGAGPPPRVPAAGAQHPGVGGAQGAGAQRLAATVGGQGLGRG